MINNFRGQYFFLSNFFNAPVKIDGINFSNSEAAFQAAKTTDYDVRLKFEKLDPRSAKALGKKVKLRDNWEEIKDDIMYQVVRAKFVQNPFILRLLIQTGDEELVESNTWHDYYWGVCNNKGQNKLGKILMRVREELK